ncbi:hypothetical protein HPP92_017606 [Vanilla planifolia]|uniref:Uncharacterized protein n=1 Tax=Vanilla planifolia TaxID=51239 RepID=A0A835UNR5_VANPL|nr:hypothetical protein HPP92_017606 [Vanilla planifolia]
MASAHGFIAPLPPIPCYRRFPSSAVSMVASLSPRTAIAEIQKSGVIACLRADNMDAIDDVENCKMLKKYVSAEQKLLSLENELLRSLITGSILCFFFLFGPFC